MKAEEMSFKMSGFVLDASIALAWCFNDEQTDHIRELLTSLESQTAFVPTLWPLEVGNTLLAAERRKRISFADVNLFLGLLRELNIKIDNETPDRSFHEILAYAYAQKLTTYDASYLELAMRKGLPLASKDRQLCEVASRLGTKILPV
jgi:predicted nucleic acid-binding protein